MADDLNLLGAVTPVISQLQTFLLDMRREHREDTDRLSDKIDGVNAKIDDRVDEVKDLFNDHESRLVVVENTRAAMKWLMRASYSIVGAAVLDFLVNHLPKMWRH